MTREQILNSLCQDKYETVRALELANERTFDAKELKRIVSKL